MLVLTRKQGESICIGNDVELTVSRIHQNRITLRFKAPEGVVIMRKELVAGMLRDQQKVKAPQ